MSGNDRTALHTAGFFAAGAAVALFLVLAWRFALQQAIWIDETTQLAGLSLPFDEQFRWLTGRSDLVLGVPTDRSPPLSYWLGSLWARVFGLTELSMRWFGIVVVSLAAPALCLAGRRVGGRAGCLAMLWLGLATPVMVVQAVEIRPYPVFFTLACWTTWAYAGLVTERASGLSARRMAAFILFATATSYSHFFGVVASGSFFVALVVHFWRDAAARRPLLWAGAIGLLSLAGLIPFLAQAFSKSGGIAESAGSTVDLAGSLKETARLGFRLVAHPVMLAAPALLVVHLAAMAGLLLLTLRNLSGAAPSGGSARASALPLILPLLVALPVLFGLSLIVRGFDVLAPHYNIWLIPVIALLLASAFRPGAALRQLSIGLILVASLCNLCGGLLLVRHGTLYSHGPGEWIAERIADPAQTLLIHHAGDPWAAAYFPVFFLTRGQTTQWLMRSDGSAARIAPEGLVATDGDIADWPRVLDLRSWRWTAENSPGSPAAAVPAMTRPPRTRRPRTAEAKAPPSARSSAQAWRRWKHPSPSSMA